MKKAKIIETKLKSAAEVAAKIGLRKKELENIGKYSAKLTFSAAGKSIKDGGKLILITSTPSVKGINGNGCNICDRLVESLVLLRKKTALCLPSFTPDQVMRHEGHPEIFPVEDVFLKNVDFFNIFQAHNLISAFLSNIAVADPNSEAGSAVINWNRASAFVDEPLRNVITGMYNNKQNRHVKEEKFEYILHSELAAVASLSVSFEDLKARVERVIVGFNKDGSQLTIKDIELEDAVSYLLKDTLKPTLMQSRRGDPAFVYVSPSSRMLPPGNITAIKTAQSLSEFVVARLDGSVDSSLEKFLDVTARDSGIKPDMIVLNTFIPELNYYGGADLNSAFGKNLESLEKGVPELLRNIESAKKFGIPVLVNVNDKRDATQDEIKIIDRHCSDLGVKVVFSSTNGSGVKQNLELVKSVLEVIRTQKSYYKPAYELDHTIKEKVKLIVKEIYGMARVSYSSKAEKELEQLELNGHAGLPVCIARSPYYHRTDRDGLLAIKSLRLLAGAGVILVEAADSERMPSFAWKYSAERLTHELFV